MEENELEQRLREAVEDSAKIGDFYAKLLSSEVFVLTAGEPEFEGERILEEETNLKLINYTMQDGTPFIPVFTSLQELQSSIEQKLSYAAMEGWTLLPLVRNTHIVINPASEYGWPLRPEEIEEILQYFSAENVTVQENTKVMIGQPAVDPVEMKTAMAEVFKRDSRVQSAHLCLMVNGEQHSLVVGVVFRPGEDYPEIFQIAGTAAQPFLPAGHMLDFTIINHDNLDGFAKALLEGDSCFYRGQTQS